ncbi:evC complex member EVC isoform X2 [Hemicordylus capensis]|uniref:evC complex member EVC isoform X2 n=1 Tax=Hemicordylus capensis TaxID=884348 RepID=UPI0023021EAA|nr:evC complex member EVC isoform X2 [Hemicordylus capensis]
MSAAAGSSSPTGPCFQEVGLQLLAHLYQLSPGLLALAVVLGIGLGIGAAAVLWLCGIGRRLIQPKKDDSQRLVEGDHSDTQEHLHEDHPLPEKKETETWTAAEVDSQPPWDTSIAEFALKAKVIYPINQKFRPLADGSSNPSLHENPKQAVLPNQILDVSSSSSLGSLSQREKEDCASSTTIHSAASDDRYQDQTFLKVASFPEVLTCDIFDVKMCLYSLFLKNLHLLDAEQRKEKYVAVLHIFRTYVANLHLKKKIPENLYENILHKQEMAFEELQNQLRSRLLNTEMSGTHESEYQTLDDLERKERDYSDHILDNMEAFWKHTNQALLFFLDQSKCSRAKANKIMLSLTEKMIWVEELLKKFQDLQTMAIQERMFNWEQLVKIINMLRKQIQEESKCRLKAVSNILDQLTKKDNLTVKQREKLLTGIHKVFWEHVEHYEDECIQLGKDLIQKYLMSHTKKIECLKELQEDEQRDLLSKSKQLESLDEFLKAYHEMTKCQRKARCNLEEESDCEICEALADVYKKLYSRYSQTLEDLVVQLFLQTLPVVTGLPLRECELLKDELQEELALQLEESERCKQKHWTFFQEQLQQEQELWMKEHAFSAVMQNHLTETNEKSIQCVLNRLGGLSKESSKYISQKHKLLLSSVLRRLALRQVIMSVLAQIRISRKRSFVLELKEQHRLQQSSSHCFDEHQWKQLKEMESHIAEEEEKLENEMRETRLEFHQQLVAETQESLQFLQQHMEQALGCALLHHARQEAAKHNTDGREDFKEILKEAVVESVYITNTGLRRLLQSYCVQLAKIQESHEDAELKIFQERTECNRYQRRQDDEQRDHQGTLNSSAAGQERMLQEQKRVMAWFDVQQQAHLVSLKQKMLLLNHMETQLENELMKAEQHFITQVAAMARLPLSVPKLTLEPAEKSGKKPRTKKKDSQSRERKENGNSEKRDNASSGQTSTSFRNTLQNRQEDEVGPVKNTKKLLEKRCNT